MKVQIQVCIQINCVLLHYLVLLSIINNGAFFIVTYFLTIFLFYCDYIIMLYIFCMCVIILIPLNYKIQFIKSTEFHLWVSNSALCKKPSNLKTVSMPGTIDFIFKTADIYNFIHSHSIRIATCHFQKISANQLCEPT